MIAKHAYEILVRAECIYMISMTDVLGAFNNRAINSKPSMATYFDRMASIIIAYDNLAHKYFGLYNYPVEEDFDLKRLIKTYGPKGKASLVYDSRLVRPSFDN
jgi:hypothetical protein